MSLFALGLRRLNRNKTADPASWPSVSVIMPARNEAEVLPWTLRSLMRQDYSGTWEIIVVDDRSDDHTPQVLRELQAEYANLRVVRITSDPAGSPKKRALAAGIATSTADVIFTTDADCQYDEGWLREMVRHLQGDVGVVAGLTIFDLPDFQAAPRWQKIQWLDFFVQNFLAAGSLGWGHAASCNGSNLCYRRKVYDEIAGFGESSAIVSGDDVLFAQRVAASSKWEMVYAKSPETLVRSLPVMTIRGLLHQRLRWASKGLTYRGSMLGFLFAIYAYYLLLMALPVATFFAPQVWSATASIWGLKLAVDTWLVYTGCRVFGQQRLQPYFIEYEIAQTITTPFFGFAGLLMPYHWKGDWYRTATLPNSMRARLVRIRAERSAKRKHASSVTADQ